MRPLLLDLFCCQGGAAMGYSRSGFDVVGIDKDPQPKYPFPFARFDAEELMELLLEGGWFEASDGHTYALEDFDAVHASPPCQRFSTASRQLKTRHNHPDLIEPTREFLLRSGLPYVMENVPGAPLENAFYLCGSMFGLKTDCGAYLRRHRYFEASFLVFGIPRCDHGKRSITVTGSTPQRQVLRNQTFETFSVDAARKAMGMGWCGMSGLSQAVPPAYTEFIGRQLIQHTPSRNLIAQENQ